MTGVTVLMPVYNAAPYLPAALESVLSQTFRDFELLAIDDGSSDASPEILAGCGDPRLRVVRFERNRGQTHALNEGLRLARGELIARQDADDLSGSRRLERQLALLRERPELALLGAQGLRVDARGRALEALVRPRETLSIRWALLFDNAFLHSAVMFRKAAVLELGGYDPAFSYSQDFELWSRVAARHTAANLGERLLVNRAHARSMTETMVEGNVDENRRILGRNLRTCFGEGISDEQVALASGLRLGLAVATVEPFLALFESLLARFGERHPEAASSRDFRQTVARQYARLVMAVRHRNPGLLARILARRLRGYPLLGYTGRAVFEAARSRARAIVS